MIQLQMLNYILDKKDYSILSTNGLNASYFSDYQNEFNYILNHYAKYNVIPDKTTFLDVFPNFDVLVVNETPAYLVSELVKDKNSRCLAKTFNEIKELVVHGKIEDAVNLYVSSTEQFSETASFKPINILQDTSRFQDYLDRANDYAKFYVNTGFSELDDLIGGWDRQEDLVTIVARNGVGKSWVLLKIALEASKQGLRVGLYSGEMSTKMVGYRADTLLGNLSNSKLIHGNLDIQFDYKQHLENIRNIKGNLIVLTPDMVDGKVGVSTLRMFVEKEHLDMLCIDQHSLLDDDRDAKNPIDKASNISKDLKILQAIKKIPIIAVSQQNRASTDKGVSTAMISQSDRIGQDSTLVIFLEKHGDSDVVMSVVKSRFSSSGKKLVYKVDFDRGVFTYIPKDVTKNVGVDVSSNEILSGDDIASGGNIF